MILRPTVVVVGMGPGPLDLVTVGTRAAIDRVDHRFMRAGRAHPAIRELLPDARDVGPMVAPDAAGAAAYAPLVEALVAAAIEHGEVLYAVPGSPVVVEPSVRALQADGRITCRLLPALSFLDLAWARLGVDPVAAGVRLLDPDDAAITPQRTAGGADRGAVLVAHVHDRDRLDDVRAMIGAADDDDVVVLARLGHPDEAVVDTTWGALLADDEFRPDRWTCLFVPARLGTVGDAVEAGYLNFHRLARTLREQCPWDRRQTHASLIPYLVEETFELVDALQAWDAADAASVQAVVEELGDVLFQVEFHATIAEQAGQFTMADVTDGIHHKLVRRHPHVFGDVRADDAETVVANWDEIKRAEKSRASVFDGVATSLPALAYTQHLMRKAAKVGFDWPDVSGPLAKLDEELGELRAALADRVDGRAGDGRQQESADARVTEELGDVLVTVVSVARHLGVDAELAMRAAAAKFRRRFEALEALAIARSVDVRTADLPTLDGLWDDVKAAEAPE